MFNTMPIWGHPAFQPLMWLPEWSSLSRYDGDEDEDMGDDVSGYDSVPDIAVQ